MRPSRFETAVRDAPSDGGRISRRARVVSAGMLPAALFAVLSGCASAPRAPAARPVAPEQKLAWILQLEDQRILREPEPPAADVPAADPRRTPAAVAPPPVADLTTLAADAEPRIRRRAAAAIGRVGLREGVAPLTPLLNDADGDVRQAALFALGLIGDGSASAAVAPLLSDPDPLMRGRAAEALGLMAAKDTAGAVSAMAAAYGRSAAVAAMEPDDERWPAPPEAEAFKLGLFALVRLGAYDALAAAALDANGKPVSSWWPVAYALQRIGDSRAVPALRELLQVQGRYTPAFAARGLGHGKDPALGDLLVPLLDPATRPREVVASAARAVGQLGASRAAPSLSALASDGRQDPNLRLLAVATLGTLKTDEGMPVVLDLITDDWPAMRAAALRAAASIDPEHFTLVLSGLEADRHWMGRAALADALGQLPPDVALERLTAMLQDSDRRVIPAVLRSLVRLRAPGVERVLFEQLEQDDFVIRSTAASLVGETTPADGLAALRKAYREADGDATYGARAAMVQAMAAYGADALDDLKAALADREWPVRVKAIEVLEKLAPSDEHRQAARPVPGVPPVRYDDPDLLAPRSSPHVYIDTAKGTIQFELAVLDAPQTARNFINLARRGFFNGLQVHRVEPNFVVQDGDPRGDGQGGPGHAIRDELNDRPYVRGTVGMALAWKDTGGSQFFITHSPQPHLDGRYTAFGYVVSGMDVVDQIQVGDVIQRVRVWDGESWD